MATQTEIIKRYLSEGKKAREAYEEIKPLFPEATLGSVRMMMSVYKRKLNQVNHDRQGIN